MKWKHCTVLSMEAFWISRDKVGTGNWMLQKDGKRGKWEETAKGWDNWVLYKWKQMYEITSCQLSTGNEDDKVVPYFEPNYSFHPVLSPPRMVLVMQRKEWEAIGRRGSSQQQKKEKSLRISGISDSNNCYFEIPVVPSKARLLSCGTLFKELVNESESLTSTGSCICSVPSQPVLWRWSCDFPSKCYGRDCSSNGGLQRGKPVHPDLPGNGF